MFRNYLVTALRNIVRNRLTTLLNVLGLALGLGAALFALLYVRHETSYDRFIPGSDRILVMQLKVLGLTSDKTPYYLAPWMRADFPEMKVTRLMPTEHDLRRGALESREIIGWADPNFFSLLPVPVLAGDPRTALSRPDAAVLTRGMARKYFGRDLPIGETIEIDRKRSLQVAAVIEDLPSATHLSPRIYASGRNLDFGMEPLDAQPYGQDLTPQVLTYVVPPGGAGLSGAALQAEMPAFVHRHLQSLEDLTKIAIAIDLVPLPQFHLHPASAATMGPHGSGRVLAAIGTAGVLIMLVAAINFVNIVTARATRRAIEVGVRKTSGAARRQLMQQFMGEALIYAFAALLLAGVMTHLLVPFIDATLAPGIAEEWTRPSLAIIALALTVGTGVLGGFYPALVLSAFRPAHVLKGDTAVAASGGVRHVLVLLQFSVLITLVLATLTIYRQTSFVLRDGLRVHGDQMLLLYSRCNDALIQELRAVRGVGGVACSTHDPVDMLGFMPVKRNDGATLNMGIAGIGLGFLDLYGVRPLVGRVFQRGRDPEMEETGRLRRVVINESAVRALGFSSAAQAVGRTVTSIEGRSEIIGVIPDFSFDLKTILIPPTMYTALRESPNPVISLKLIGRDIPEILQAIDAIWKRVGEPHLLRRTFLDQELQQVYLQTMRQGQLIGALSVTAILIACLGLFGLSAFVAEQRTREIGVRKAMGASKTDILRLLLWQFARPVLWANLIAWPAAYFIMRRWLEGFAYHIDLRPWMFLSASVLALVIAVTTVIGHALMVSRAKPVAALRYE